MMDLPLRAAYVTGSFLAASPQVVPLESWVSALGSLGGFGVLLWAVSYTMKLLQKKDEIIAARDKQIFDLTQRLLEQCKNCDLTKAANKELIERD